MSQPIQPIGPSSTPTPGVQRSPSSRQGGPSFEDVLQEIRRTMVDLQLQGPPKVPASSDGEAWSDSHLRELLDQAEERYQTLMSIRGRLLQAYSQATTPDRPATGADEL